MLFQAFKRLLGIPEKLETAANPVTQIIPKHPEAPATMNLVLIPGIGLKEIEMPSYDAIRL